MLTFFSDLHAGHHVQQFIRHGRIVEGRDVPARAENIRAAVTEAGHAVTYAADFGLKPVSAVHTPEYLDFLMVAWDQWSKIGDASDEVIPYVFPVRGMVGSYPRSIVGRAGYHMHDLWAPIGRHSCQAALASANLAVAAADHVLRHGEQAYALCRPSGHHAYADMGGGACFLNNAAIAAEHLRRQMDRVAIIDVDVHHGNGTQGIFYHRSDVLFVSIHRDPIDYHPFFVGHASERGEGAGLGHNLNLPLPAHSPDVVVLEAVKKAAEQIRLHGSDALVVSLGVDGHEHDPTNGLSISYEGFRQIGERLSDLGLPTVIIQEGGYNPGTIGRCVVNSLAGFEGKFGKP